MKTVDEAFADYEPTRAARAINDFVNDNLSNWYVRLNRKRYWGKEMDADKLAAYQTLYTCLETVARLIAPIAPFYADRLYADLTAVTAPGTSSIHLQDFPAIDEAVIDPALENRMALAQQITSMVLSLRRKADLKVRQPLSRIMVPAVDAAQRQAVESMMELILSEVNIKALDLVDGDSGVLVKRVKPDFKKLGPKYGKMMKQVAAAIQQMTQQQIAELERNAQLTLTVDGTEAVIDLADVEVISEDIPGWLVANEGNVTVALDITLTAELVNEGIARDIVNRIQNIRKSRGYEITDKISLTFVADSAYADAINQYGDYIAHQVLATDVVMVESLAEGVEAEVLQLDEMNITVAISLS